MLLPLTAPTHPTSCPTGKRILGNRQAWPISAEEPLALKVLTPAITDTSLSLRLVAAVDHRSNQQLNISCHQKNIGSLCIYGATAGAVYTCDIAAEHCEHINTYGIEVSVEQHNEPFYIVSEHKTLPDIGPHLWLADGDTPPLTNFFKKVCSLASLQPCDWMETCVLDGIYDLSKIGLEEQGKAALNEHLRCFYANNGNFERENIYGQPADNQPCTEENGGHAAVAAFILQQHPGLDLASASFRAHWNQSVQAIAHSQVAAETAYSVAYPMMALAHTPGRQDQDLAEKALQQLRCCRDKLNHNGHLWLRCNLATGELSFPSWSRGIAWYLLGMVRTLALLPATQRPQDLLDEVGRCATWTIDWQRADGLWPCFLREADTPPDTSGSAGIAAAIALAVKHAMIHGADFSSAAARAHQGLIGKLTPDGWLTGVAPSNKGEYAHLDIQRMDYRIIGPWGMGLMAQLHAALIGKVWCLPK